MRTSVIAEKMYLVAGLLALAGAAALLSVVFAGPGVLLIMAAVVPLLAGLTMQLGEGPVRSVAARLGNLGGRENLRAETR